MNADAKTLNKIKITKWRLGVVVHACNPHCVGGRDQEGHGSRPGQTEKSM
jgi:hypothetical protein